MNKTVFIVKKVEIRPLPNSELRKNSPLSIGAITDVVIAAFDKQEAEKKAKKALLEDGYEFVSLEDVLEFTKCSWEEDNEIETKFKAMAWDAYSEDVISYGPFYCWDKDE